MSKRNPITVNSHGWFKRMSYLVAACIFLVLGIIGLVLPVIPGVVFLLIAALILARVSRRVDGWVKSHPVARSTQARVETIGRLRWPDKVRIAFWYAGAGLASVVSIAVNGMGRLRRAISQGN